MSLVLKRGRGRPRLNESREFNDSVLQLISEFRKRPALFDKNHPMYRDKENTERIWQEMSEVLNTPVSQLKDRTTQLRNRFNIERRRIDNIVEQGGDEQAIKPQWALYEHLTFLNDHIKTRRPLLPSRPESPIVARTSKRVKMQTTQSNTTSTSDEEDDVDVGGPIGNATLPFQSSYAHSSNDYLRYGQTNGYSNGTSVLYNSHEEHSSFLPAENSAKREIYQSFGNFVSSSLIGMREKDALRLLEKFTKELVQSMNSPANSSDV